MWMILVALLVLGFGIFMFQMGSEIFEESKMFGIGVAIFFVLFIGAAILFSVFGPSPEGSSDIGGLVQAAVDITPE